MSSGCLKRIRYKPKRYFKGILVWNDQSLQCSWFAIPVPYFAGKVLLTAWALIVTQHMWDQKKGFSWFAWQQGPVTVLLWAPVHTQMISHSRSLKCSTFITAKLSCETERLYVVQIAQPALCENTSVHLFVFPLLFGSGNWHPASRQLAQTVLLLTPLQTNGDYSCKIYWVEVEMRNSGNVVRSLGDYTGYTEC